MESHPTIQSFSTPRGELLEPPSSSQPISSPGYEFSPDYISMIRGLSFSGFKHENPYEHLREFEHLCSCRLIHGMTQETLKWKLFPFSLNEKAKQWYTYTAKRVNGDWKELRDKFCLAFFPVSRITSLRAEIIGFRQEEKETLSASWIRFCSLTDSGPELLLPEPVLLQHFYSGLSNDTALYLDTAAGGSFSHKTIAEAHELLDRIVENTPFSADLLVEPESEDEELVVQETQHLVPMMEHLALESSSNTRTMIEEDEPLEFPFEFEEEIFENFGNTSNYTWVKTPPPSPPDPPKNPFHKEDMTENHGKTVFTTTTTQNPLENPHHNHEPLEQVKFISRTRSLEPSLYEDAKFSTHEEDEFDETFYAYEPKRSSSPFEPFPSGPSRTVLDDDQELFENKPWAMEFHEASTLESKEESLNEHRSFFFEQPYDTCSHHESLGSMPVSANTTSAAHNHLGPLFCYMFFRMVVDTFVYHKYCKYRACILLALTLQVLLRDFIDKS